MLKVGLVINNDSSRAGAVTLVTVKVTTLLKLPQSPVKSQHSCLYDSRISTNLLYKWVLGNWNELDEICWLLNNHVLFS